MPAIKMPAEFVSSQTESTSTDNDRSAVQEWVDMDDDENCFIRSSN